jgi:hypothetical protein
VLNERRIQFNVLWLNSNNHETFPPGLIDALAIHAGSTIVVVESNSTDTIQSRLRKQMQAEALQPISNNVDDAEQLSSAIPPVDQFSDEFLEEAVQFLRLQVSIIFFPLRVSELLFSGGR